MLSCRKASELISHSLDRRLGVRERMSLTMHLAMCRLCNRYRRQVTFVSRAAREMLRHPTGGQDLSPALPEAARIRCRRSIEEAKKREE